MEQDSVFNEQMKTFNFETSSVKFNLSANWSDRPLKNKRKKYLVQFEQMTSLQYISNSLLAPNALWLILCF